MEFDFNLILSRRSMTKRVERKRETPGGGWNPGDGEKM